MKLSLVVPCFNEEGNVERFFNEVNNVFLCKVDDYEFVFINDGSKDNTYKKLKEIYENNSAYNIQVLSFSRNFGKESAISAGLAAVSGECAVVIDCDLQHPPEKIIEMYRLWEQGYEIVEGIKNERGNEKKMHGIGAKLFYSVISRMAGFDMANSSDFKLLDRKVVDVLNKMPERGFFRAISFWVGYKKATVEYDVAKRVEGESKWSTKGLCMRD